MSATSIVKEGYTRIGIGPRRVQDTLKFSFPLSVLSDNNLMLTATCGQSVRILSASYYYRLRHCTYPLIALYYRLCPQDPVGSLAIVACPTHLCQQDIVNLN